MPPKGMRDSGVMTSGQKAASLELNSRIRDFCRIVGIYNICFHVAILLHSWLTHVVGLKAEIVRGYRIQVPKPNVVISDANMSDGRRYMCRHFWVSLPDGTVLDPMTDLLKEKYHLYFDDLPLCTRLPSKEWHHLWKGPTEKGYNERRYFLQNRAELDSNYLKIKKVEDVRFPNEFNLVDWNVYLNPQFPRPSLFRRIWWFIRSCKRALSSGLWAFGPFGILPVYMLRKNKSD